MIDFHTYPYIIKEFVDADMQKQVQEVFGLVSGLQPLDTFLLRMQVAGIDKAVLLPIDCTTARGCKLFSNEQIAEVCKASDRFIGFASVDPHAKSAPDDLKKAVEKLGLKGLKLSPGIQEFFPNDEKVFPIYKAASELGIPVMIHVGMNWGRGALLKYGMPLLIEDVAVRFPDLKIVMTRMGWPWVLDAMAIMLKYQNVFCDTAGHVLDTPQRFVQFEMAHQIPVSTIENSLREQIIFGSDYPRLWIKTMVDAVRSLDLSDDCFELIFRKNAERLLNIG